MPYLRHSFAGVVNAFRIRAPRNTYAKGAMYDSILRKKTNESSCIHPVLLGHFHLGRTGFWIWVPINYNPSCSGDYNGLGVVTAELDYCTNGSCVD